MLLAAAALALPTPAPVGGVWTHAAVYTGTLEPNATASHRIEVGSPSDGRGGGLVADAGRPTIALRPGGVVLDGTLVHATLRHPAGPNLLQARIVPNDPGALHHGPATVSVQPGRYTLEVHNPGNATTAYSVEASATVGYRVVAEGAVVPPWAPLVPALALAVLALAPEVLARARAAPARPGAPEADTASEPEPGPGPADRR